MGNILKNMNSATSSFITNKTKCFFTSITLARNTCTSVFEGYHLNFLCSFYYYNIAEYNNSILFKYNKKLQIYKSIFFITILFYNIYYKMEHAAQWLREQEHLRENRQTPAWLLLTQEFAPINSIDSSNYPKWLTIRIGTTPNDFPFSMTLVEFEKIHLGSYPSTTRSTVVNRYYRLINYFNQLDFSQLEHRQNFEDWKTWWKNSLDLIIPKSDLVDEYNSIIFKGYANMTSSEHSRIAELNTKIAPYPERYKEPIMLDLASEPRAFPFIPYVWNFNIESYSDYYKRLNRAGGKYKRTKKQKKYKKHKKKNGKNTHHRSKH